jgi:hypothetical protein
MRWAPKPLLAWYFTRSVRSEILVAGQDLELPAAR